MSADFATWLQETVRAHGALAAGCLARDQLDLDALRHRFDAWLHAAGNAGALGYIDPSLPTRCDPFGARPWAKSCIVVAFPGDWGRTELAPPLPAPAAAAPAGYISAYACGLDYHTIGQRLLHRLAEAVAALAADGHPAIAEAEPARFEACVDTRPVPEVFLAVSAGLGVLGPNGLLRTPQRGSRVFIGALFTSLELPSAASGASVQTATVPACAECGACLRKCPTGALRADGLIGVRRCRSWLSMECRGVLTAAQQAMLGDCLFGCDGCTSACPAVAGEGATIAVDVAWLASAPAAEIRRRIDGTALAYAGPTLLRRNALVILGPHLGASARGALRDRILRQSSSPVLRGTVEGW